MMILLSVLIYSSVVANAVRFGPRLGGGKTVRRTYEGELWSIPEKCEFRESRQEQQPLLRSVAWSNTNKPPFPPSVGGPPSTARAISKYAERAQQWLPPPPPRRPPRTAPELSPPPMLPGDNKKTDCDPCQPLCPGAAATTPQADWKPLTGSFGQAWHEVSPPKHGNVLVKTLAAGKYEPGDKPEIVETRMTISEYYGWRNEEYEKWCKQQELENRDWKEQRGISSRRSDLVRAGSKRRC